MTMLLRDPEPAERPVPVEPLHRPPRGRIAALIVAAGLTGGLGATGVLAATGALDRSSSHTTVVNEVATSSTGARSGLDAGALYAAAAPGVVDITSNSAGTSGGAFGGLPQSESSTATGTGFVVDGDGHIVTAAHVVDGADSVTVTFNDGTARTAKVLGTDNATDLAVLSVDASGLTLHPLKLGSSSSLRIGDAVAAIGDPFNYDRSLSTGIVSGVDRTISAPNGFTVAHAIQTDAALNPGNSGGPMLAANGTVIGVVDQIATDSGADQSSGVGFAVPSDIVKAELADLIAGRTVRHAYLGVSTGDATASTAGALVGSVASGGPAADAGLRAGDVVTSIDGTAVKGSSDLVAAIADHKPGDRVKVVVRRGSRTVTETVTLGRQPTSRAAQG